MPEKETKKSFTIHDMPISERPRERLQRLGAENLSAQEILAVVMGRGIRGESVLVTAQRLLEKFGSLQGIANATVEELSDCQGHRLSQVMPVKGRF